MASQQSFIRIPKDNNSIITPLKSVSISQRTPVANPGGGAADEFSPLFSPNEYGLIRPKRDILWDWIVIITLGTVFLILEYGIHPHHQCISGHVTTDDSPCGTERDPDLYHPYLGSTVSFGLCVSTCFLSWMIVLCSSVALMMCYRSHPTINRQHKFQWKVILFKIESLFRVAFFALTLNQSCTDVIKTTVGRPRPNYWNIHDQEDKALYVQARMSFPSGHSSFAFCSQCLLSFLLLRTIIYTQFRTQASYSCHSTYMYFGEPIWIALRKCYLLSVFCGLLPIMLAIFIAMTRLTDYWHHYSDVLCGIMIGVTSASISYVVHRRELFGQSSINDISTATALLQSTVGARDAIGKSTNHVIDVLRANEGSDCDIVPLSSSKQRSSDTDEDNGYVHGLDATNQV